jgi:hypothetical protein
MHTLPADFPIAAFVGYRVTEVIEGAHFVDVGLELDGRRAKISFEGPGSLTVRGEPAVSFANSDLTEGANVFRRLLTSRVACVRRSYGPGVAFDFENGASLELLDAVGSFESYHLSVEGRSCDV